MSESFGCLIWEVFNHEGVIFLEGKEQLVQVDPHCRSGRLTSRVCRRGGRLEQLNKVGKKDETFFSCIVSIKRLHSALVLKFLDP